MKPIDAAAHPNLFMGSQCAGGAEDTLNLIFRPRSAHSPRRHAVDPMERRSGPTTWARLFVAPTNVRRPRSADRVAGAESLAHQAAWPSAGVLLAHRAIRSPRRSRTTLRARPSTS